MSKKSKDDDLLSDAKEAFQLASETEDHNRIEAAMDLRFGRLGEQWPETIKRQRELSGRPCLTINKLPAMIRQVVNDARQNRPALQVHPANSSADKETAEIINGLFRSIENASQADIAYDTALDFSVSCGFGFLKVGIEYADDDSFDKDIRIEAVANPFGIFGDPYSRAADGSDWTSAFETEMLSKDDFKKRFGKATASSWDAGRYEAMSPPWTEDGAVRICRWWRREESPRTILMLSDMSVVGEDDFLANPEAFAGLTVMGEREVPSHKVRHVLMSGADILESDEVWPGRYIPIIPVYGEDINVEGKRYLRSMVRDARDPQRMFNYWRTTSTELVALSPRAPFIGRKGTFDFDKEKWSSANTDNHAYIEFDGPEAPIRQPFPAAPAGALQEALNAADDLKTITGMYDPSQGRASTADQSGRAIMALQREGDVGSFHFIDNLSRAIRQTGRVVLDLIPLVYNTQRTIRIMGADGTPSVAQIAPGGAPQPQPMPAPTGQPGLPPQALQQAPTPGMPQGQPQGPIDPVTGQPMQIAKVYDLTVGKYDATVDSGPSFTTRREESANQMIDFIHAFPASAPVVGPLLAKNLDWPGSEEIADGLQQLAQQATQAKGQDPHAQAAMQKAQADIQAKQQMAQSDIQIEQQKAQLQAQLAQQKLQADIELKRQQMQMEMELQRQSLMYSAQIKEAEARARLDQTVELPEDTIGGRPG
jgi:hypothetical protein